MAVMLPYECLYLSSTMFGPRAGKKGRHIRVATWNIRHGAGLDGVVDLERTAATLLSLRAEVIGLQEVDRGWARSGGADQASVIAELIGMEVVFKPSLVRDGGEYGLALAATERVSADLELLPGKQAEEPRAVLVARTLGLSVLVTHLSRHADTRRLQAQRLAVLARRVSPPVVLLGDLNQGRRGLGALRRAGLRGRRRPTPTVPADRPMRQIDHVLAGRGAVVEKVWVVESAASDHRPLVASIRVAEDQS